MELNKARESINGVQMNTILVILNKIESKEEGNYLPNSIFIMGILRMGKKRVREFIKT